MNEICRQWDKAAEAYLQDQQNNSQAALNRRMVMERFSELQGLQVLDAGCGFGWYTDYFFRAGAEAVGCDGSAEMLRLAKERYPDCTFQQVDLLGKLPFADASFDLVLCNQVMMDLPEVETLFAEIGRVLRPGGCLYLVIVHPAFYPAQWQEDAAGVRIGKAIRDYGKTYRIGHRYCGVTTHIHRPISAYLNPAAEQRLLLRNMEEPWEDTPGDRSALPMLLMMEFGKY